MKNLKVYSLIAARAALLALATPAFAGTLNITSGPTFTPDTAFTNNTIHVETLHSPPGVMGDLVKLSGDATITPPASNTASIAIAGSYSANAGELVSAAYSITIDSNVSGPVTYTVRGAATFLGNPLNFSKTDTVMPGLHQYRGAIQTPISFPVTSSGTFSGSVSVDFGAAASRATTLSDAAPGTINLSIQRCDFQLAPTVATIPAPSQALNISTRLAVETGDNVLIGGFIITGTQPKKIIVRAIGPSLPLAGALANPVLELHGPGAFATITNDNWRTGGQEADIIATTIPPSNDLESAIVATLPANNAVYTAIVRGVNNGTGIGLVDAYDLDQTVDSKLANISTRGLVQTGDNVLIGGFIVGPESNDASSIVVRAIGPSLAPGVANPLQDPTLELRNDNGTLIASNDNWMDSSNKQTIIDNGLAPTNDNESALLAIPAPGNFTAIVHGKNNTTGVAVVEAYVLQ